MNKHEYDFTVNIIEKIGNVFCIIFGVTSFAEVVLLYIYIWFGFLPTKLFLTFGLVLVISVLFLKVTDSIVDDFDKAVIKYSKTNGDKVRSMSNEEIANYISENIEKALYFYTHCESTEQYGFSKEKDSEIHLQTLYQESLEEYKL